MARLNGGISGRLNTSTKENASGIWSLSEVQLARSNNLWPDLFSGFALRLDFDETTTLDSRITFTRATNGTYFNSSGVLTTAGSGVPRFDHRLEGGVWVNKGLLIEEARTNLALRSEEFGTTWITEQATVTNNSTNAPTGTAIADSLIESIGSAVHSIRQTVTIAANTTHTFSIFIKALGSGATRYARLQFQNDAATNGCRALFDLQNGIISLSPVNFGSGSGATASITNFGNGWYRCSLTGKVDSSTTAVRFYVFMQEVNNTYVAPYTGVASSGLFLFGAQVEAGAFPTSYIKTTTASVTRNADVASMTSTNFSSWYNATEGTIFWRGDIIGSSAGSTRLYSVSDGTESEYFQGNATNSSGNGFTWALFDGGTVQAVLNTPDPAVPPSANITYKHASAYKVNDFAASRDGGTVATDTSGTLPTVNKLGFGTDVSEAAGFLNGHIAKFYYWNTRIPNEVLRSLTE